MALSFVGYAVSPVFVMGLPPRYLSCLAFLPGYVAWKMLVATGSKPTEWVRTRRESALQAERRQPAAVPPGRMTQPRRRPSGRRPRPMRRAGTRAGPIDNK